MTIQLPTAPAALVPEFSFGDRLRKARELAGYDRKELGEALGIHRQTITRYETDLAVPTQSVVVVWGLITQVDLGWIKTGQCTPRDLNSEPTGLESENFALTAARHPAETVERVYTVSNSEPTGLKVKRRRPPGAAFVSDAASILEEIGVER